MKKSNIFLSIIFSIVLTFMASCSSKPKDNKNDYTLITANKIFTVDSNFLIANAMIINQNKITEVGTKAILEKKYNITKRIDYSNEFIYPGLYDAHAHFYGMGLQQQKVNLLGTKSWEEVLKIVQSFQEKHQLDFITGRGWDQNDWELKEYPSNKELNLLFPNTPVILRRIDGHALIANQKAIEMARVNEKTKYSGGLIEIKNNKLTGLFIDNPMDLLLNIIPEPSQKSQLKALKDADEICIKNGLSTVVDAGLNKNILDLIIKNNTSIKTHLYLMASATDPELYSILRKGLIDEPGIKLRGIKYYADGALGSRGACLHDSYTDKENHFGALLSSTTFLDSICVLSKKHGFQLNTHAIGDSANSVVLNYYSRILQNPKPYRWRIEHAQVLTEKSFEHFATGIIPSVQPTHATSDMYWAKDRLGSDRVKDAYAYKKILNQSKIIALGTDFPIEKVNPFYTFYSAVARKDLNKFPKNGFQKENALSRIETLKGMTIWAAYSCFQENEKGSIEPGKIANFVVLDRELLSCPEDSIPFTKVKANFIDGQDQLALIKK